MHPITKYYREMSHRLIEEYYEGENNAEVNYNYSRNEDSIVKELCEDFKRRSETGIKKYGVTLDREDLSLSQWLQHSIEEKMDDLLYTKKIKKLVDSGEIEKLIKRI